MLGVGLGAIKEAFPVNKGRAESGAKRKPLEAQNRLGAATAKRTRAGASPPSPKAENEKHALVVNAFLENSAHATADVDALGCSNAPTDFAGLIPGGSSKNASLGPRQQQGIMAAGAASQQQRTARTFEDITRQHASRGPLADRPPADFLPPCLAPSLHPDATSLTVLAEPGAERRLAPSPSPPLDWSLKTTARFSSPLAFSVVEEALAASGGEAVAAQRAFAGGLGTGCLSLRQQLLAALLSFQFPQDPQPPSDGGSGGAGRPRGGGLSPPQLARRQAWQSALCSLYDAFRCGRCDAFYCVSPEGSRRPFVAFFGAAGLGGRRRLHGLLTRTTAGLRALLKRDGCGPATPLMPDARPAPEDLSAPPVEGTQSLAVFEGVLRCHGLFDFLLNESFRCHGDECDVPLLLAPAPFMHAALAAAPLRVLGAAEGAAAGGRGAQHRFELRGVLPPWVVDRLACLLAVTQDGSLSLVADTHPLTLALNWRPGSGGGSGGPAAAAEPRDDFAAREAGCWDLEEARRWRAATPGLACNVLRELRCKGGTFVGHLSSRSAERAL